MVSTKIFAATDTKVRTESNYVANKSAKASDDFTKTLDSTMKSSDNKYSKSDNNVKTVEKSGKALTGKEQMKKLLKQGDSDSVKTDKDILEDNAGTEALNQIAVLGTAIIKELSEQFHVAEEEVSQVMENLSLDDFDMLDVQKVFEVITELSGHEELAELITDDSMALLLKNMKQEVSDVSETIEKLGITREVYDEAVKMNTFEALNHEAEPVDDVNDESVIDSAYNVKPEKTDNTDAFNSTDNMNEQTSKDTSDNHQVNDKTTDTGTRENIHNSVTFQSVVSTTDIIGNIEEFIGESDSVRESGLSENIFRQILDGISANAGPDTTSLELQLNPESLGKVHITVSSRAGVLTAQIAAQNQVAKEAIESQINVLRESFEGQGLKVEEVEITLASRGFEQSFDREEQGNEKNQPRRGRHISQSELDEINGISSDKDELVDEVHKEQGNTVSYTA